MRSYSRLLFVLLCAALIIPAAADTNVLFDFESGDVSSWVLWSWPAAISRRADTDFPHSGTYALGMGMWIEAQWGGVSNGVLPTNDWSAYDRISYWVRAEDYHHTGDWIKIRLNESSGERWSQMHATPITNVYQRVDRQLLSNYQSTNGFELADGGGQNYQLDLTNIVSVEFIFSRPVDGNMSDTNYFVDDIELSTTPLVATLSVEPAAIGFGSLNPSPSDHRYISTNAVTVNYEVSGYSSWSIEIYSDFSGGVAGLIGQVHTNYILPRRSWWDEVPATPPDPEPDGNWTQFWSAVTHKNEAWHPTLTDDSAPLASGFKVYFATDATAS